MGSIPLTIRMLFCFIVILNDSLLLFNDYVMLKLVFLYTPPPPLYVTQVVAQNNRLNNSILPNSHRFADFKVLLTHHLVDSCVFGLYSH